MPPLAYYLAAFAVYTISIILLTGQSFPQRESLRSFYIGRRGVPLWPTVGTFCATWISPLSLVGFSMWYYREGYIAFWASVNGWMLGFLLFPFIVGRLRRARVVSLPEWLEKTYGDARVRKLAAAAMVLLYTIYLVIQFRAFGIIVSYMLEIPRGFASTSLIYLFVLYTTFGGYPSVVRSDTAYRGRGQRRCVVCAARRFQPLRCGRRAEVGGRTLRRRGSFSFRCALRHCDYARVGAGRRRKSSVCHTDNRLPQQEGSLPPDFRVALHNRLGLSLRHVFCYGVQDGASVYREY